MKDEINLSRYPTHEQTVALIDDWIDYYNNSRYQWDLEKFLPNECWQYICSGMHPLDTLPP